LEPTAEEHVRRAGFERPQLRGAILLLHFHVQPDVRVQPFHLDDRAGELDGLVGVEFGGEGVMGRHPRRGAREAQSKRHDADRQFHSHGFILSET